LVLIGADRFMTRANVSIGDFKELGEVLALTGVTPLYAATDGQMVGLIGVTDPIKDSAFTAIGKLIELGLIPVMITGDNPLTARSVAGQLGIDSVVVGVLPDGKVSVIQTLQTEGKRVASTSS